MAEQFDHDSTAEELEKLLNDKEFCHLFTPENEAAPGTSNETVSSIAITPDPLNMAFIDEETNVNEQHSQASLSQQQLQSQTTNEASAAIHGLISTIVAQEHGMVNLRSATPTMKSVGTMPKTPTMISTGTMPKTPTMKSMGTMPKTPTPTTTTSSSGSVTETIDLVSPTIGTIDLCSPDTPTNTDTSNSSPYLAPQ